MLFISVGIVSAADTNTTSLTIDSEYNQDCADENLGSSNQEILDAEVSEDISTVDSGTVSGGVDVVAKHPWGPSDSQNGNHGELVYNVPSKATNVKCAYVYVSIYSGSAQPTYGSIADISIKTNKGYLNKTENLWISSGTTDGINYVVNDHITKCYSDYQIFYNITNLAKDSKGTPISIHVSSLPMSGKSFDGRIKLISLILAYDDGDSDKVDYWINAGQAWTDAKTYTYFESGDADIDSKTKVTLTNIGLSSNDAVYEINGESLFAEEGDEYISGDYYQYHKWDITDYFSGDTEIAFTSSKDGWASFKEVLSVLIIDHNYSAQQAVNNKTTVDFKTEYSTDTNPAICIYAGTNNTVTANLLANSKGLYSVELLANGAVVDTKSVNLLKNVEKTIYLTDPTIRTVNQKTAAGAKNVKVNYTVRILLNNKVINSTSYSIPVLYNGYLGKDLAYPKESYESFYKGTVTGDIVIDTQDKSTYLERTDLQRTDVWSVKLPKNSNFVKAYIYVPYNYFIPDYSNNVPEDIKMFTVKFNGASTLPVGFYRDQSNLGNYAKYGYGLLVYDVTDLIKSGNNTFVLKKKDTYPAVSPSTLVYMYNTTNSLKLKEIYISNGADLLENSYNLANRTVKSDVVINVNSNSVDDATLYVFAAGAQKGEGNIAFNSLLKSNVWRGTLYTTDMYKLNVKKYLKKENTISFISTGSTIQALQQIIVLNKTAKTSVTKISSDNKTYIFAGVKNAITVNIDNTRVDTCTVKLFADGNCVGTTEASLKGDKLSVVLTDPTIRSATSASVYGATHEKVNYTVKILINGKVVNTFSKTVSILYDGYLGKAWEYPKEGYDTFFSGTITGDIKIMRKATYLSIPSLKKTDVWSVKLPKKSNFVKAYIYVPYYFFDPSLGIKEGKNMFSSQFNGVNVTPVKYYRDQSNYGTYAKNGYGLLVYDVTKLITTGNNTFTINKNKATTTVCPSTLIYLYNTTDSLVSKNVYISNNADLLSATSVSTLKQAKSNSYISADLSNKINDAKLYVFAAGAQKNEGNVIFNGNVSTNVWNGKAFTTELFTLDVTGNLKKSNSISFVSTGDTILSLQRILVTSFNKTKTSISAGKVNMVYLDGTKLVAKLKDSSGKAISKKVVSITINGKTYSKTTNSTGQVALGISLAPNTYNTTLAFSGDAKYIKSSASVNVVVKKGTPTITAAAKTFETSLKTKVYTITLKNHKKEAMASTAVSIKVDGKTYSAKTNSSGVATFKITDLTNKGPHIAVITYAGNKYYNKVTKNVTIYVKSTPVIVAKAATFKASTKTKTYTITLKADSKIVKSAKMTLKVNKITYNATTDSKGVATFKITQLTKKGEYTAQIAFAGSKYYKAASKSVKITVS